MATVRVSKLGKLGRSGLCAITGFIDVPAHTTFCRFRNLLTQLKLWDGLLRKVNRQFEEASLI